MLTIGQLLQERYHITALLGQGGMGAVYRAYDNRLNKECVVKEMLNSAELMTNSAAAAEQFKREASVLAALRHPNLPVVGDYFIDHGNNYLVMDFVEGQNLHDLIGGQALPEATVLNYANQLLDVLEYIHGKGVVHRDIKPANIIIKFDGRVMLVDFGLVKVMTPGVAGTNTFLRGVGTPEYAPPEQMRGGTDQRSDLYSLGATLYHALTGRLPFEVSDRAMLDMPGIRALNPAVSARMERVVQKAMMLRREMRYQSAAEMRGELGGASAPKPTVPPQPPTHPKTVVIPRGDQNGVPLPAPINAPQRPRRLLIGVAVGAAVLLLIAAVALRAAPDGGASTPVPTITLPGGVQMVLLRVPAGEFLMGSADSDKDAKGSEKPQHKVTLDEYWIGKTEVTNAQYGAYAQAKGLGWSMPTGKENHPVVSVSWDDAVAFCAWVSEISGKQVRLPTEAEWEKAARGDNGRFYPWGNQSPDSNLLNFNNNVKDTTEVGKYSPAGDSPYGAQDMAGNVWEWTSSLYKDYPYNAKDGREDQNSREARVLRGGSWLFNRVNARAACRFRDFPLLRNSNFGFRVVVRSAPVP